MAEISPSTRRLVRGVVDYGGLVVFLVGFLVTHDVVKATWWLVAGSAAALVLGFVVERRIAPMPLLAGGAALFFGALTLIFHDDRFIKMKPTFMNLAFAAFLLGGTIMGKSPLKVLMGKELPMSDRVWKTLTWRYGAYFLLIAIVNEAVWRTQPAETWVFFRFPGLMILAVIFSLTQTRLIMAGMKEAEDAAKAEEPKPDPLAER